MPDTPTHETASADRNPRRILGLSDRARIRERERPDHVRQRAATGAAKVALNLLHKAIAEAGEMPPASNHIPTNTRTCRTSVWRSYCYAGTVAESDNPDTKQKAFVRASKQLQALGLIGVWNDNVWVAGHAGHSRT
jgi:hypothetical protein